MLSSKQAIDDQESIIHSIIEKDSRLNDYIFSLENMLVQKKFKKIRLSRDAGKSWGNWLSIDDVGFIRFIHVFKNASVLICNDTQAFYSTDWKSIKKSNVYDVDGQLYRNDAPFHNFSAYTHDGIRQIIDGKEIICWGTYSNEAHNDGFTPRIWYSSDMGKTIKCAFRFGKSIAQNTSEAYHVRHVHCVNFNAMDKSFWAQTGDAPNESMWLKGTYDHLTDSITWNLIGQGRNYLTASLYFDKEYVYAAWEVSNGGIFRVRYEDILNEKKREMVFSTTPDLANVLIVGRKGDMLLLTTNAGHPYQLKYIYYSPDGKSFYPINVYFPKALNPDYPSIYYGTFGVNSSGKVLAGIRNQSLKLSEWCGLPCIWLDDLVREAGFPNAFRE